MADLSKIGVGDILLIPVKVLHADDAYGAPVKVAFETVEFWLDRDTVNAAEHIPAPRAFKRGDWVKLHGEEAPNQGLVVAEIPKGPTRQTGALYTVNWPNGGYFEYLADDLEPDEAPE